MTNFLGKNFNLGQKVKKINSMPFDSGREIEEIVNFGVDTEIIGKTTAIFKDGSSYLIDCLENFDEQNLQKKLTAEQIDKAFESVGFTCNPSKDDGNFVEFKNEKSIKCGYSKLESNTSFDGNHSKILQEVSKVIGADTWHTNWDLTVTFFWM
jgi:hypothetical protein